MQKTSLLYLCLILGLFSCADDEQALPTPVPATFVPIVTNPTTTVFSNATSFDCTNILIDASHDGGVWWYPQAGAFDPSFNHQGKVLADILREKGFRVDEVPRGQRITDELLKNYSVIIRASGFEPYEPSEVEAYGRKIQSGVTLLLLSDHQKNDTRDEVADLLNVKFEGGVAGEISIVNDHPILAGRPRLNYLFGSFIANADKNENIVPLGTIGEAMVVAELKHPRSKIFVMGDVNSFEFQPKPFAENFASWATGECLGR